METREEWMEEAHKKWEQARRLGYSKEMYIASILSDIREELDLTEEKDERTAGAIERAVDMTNEAKLLLFEVPWWDGREERLRAETIRGGE